jgi:hypothetical protein
MSVSGSSELPDENIDSSLPLDSMISLVIFCVVMEDVGVSMWDKKVASPTFVSTKVLSKKPSELRRSLL